MKQEHSNVFSDRRKKLVDIRKAGIDPYPSLSKRTMHVREASERFSELQKKEITLGGRIRSMRLHGKSCFSDLQDESGTVQIFLKFDLIGEEKFNFFKRYIDIGDFLQVKGVMFKTRKGEKTLLVSEFVLLSKSLQPLPEKWHGLKDAEERFRKRYLDLIMNPKVKRNFLLRSAVIKKIRAYLDKEGFIEVETPVLQQIPGGTNARPFQTHINAYDLDLYLRIAPELYLKRLIVGGFEKVYEIGKMFRNEGVDHTHNPEFTSCEFYWAYQDYQGLMDFTEQMISSLVQDIMGSQKIIYQGQHIDFTPPWKRISISDAIKNKTKIDILQVTDEKQLSSEISKKGYSVGKHANYAKLVDDLFKDSVMKFIVQPTFIINHPVELEPLAKKSARDPRVVERFQPIVAGRELLKAYSELNDPVDQLQRFQDQQLLRDRGDDEAQFIDKDFVEALEYGMPPTAGWGMGIDRFVALLANAISLREVIIFPLMKPKMSKQDNSQDMLPSDSSKDFNNSKYYKTNLRKTSIDEVGLSLDEAKKRAQDRFSNKNLYYHSLAVGAVMKALAQHFNDNTEAWEIAGLLHDLDYEETSKTPSKHGLKSADELEKAGLHPEITQAIRAHNPVNGTEPESLIEHALFSADPVTGFIVACALVRPDKKIKGLTLSSIIKKFHDKSFAKGACRSVITSCVQFGMKRDDFLQLSLNAMKLISDEIGL